MTEANRGLSRDRRIILIPLLACLLLVLFPAYLVFRHFLLTFTVSASVALLLAPVQRRVSRMLRGRSGVAAAILVFLVAVLILAPVLTSATLLGKQAVGFFEWVRPRLQPDALQAILQTNLIDRHPGLGAWLNMEHETLPQLISGGLSRLAQGANRFIQGAVTELTGALLELVLFLMILFFLLRDGGRLREELRSISPLSEVQEKEIFDHLEKTVKGVLQAMVVVPLAQGVVALLAFSVFGVPSPLLWAVMVVLAALVPLLGSPLAWVPAVAYLFVYGATWQWAGMLLFGLLGISMIDNIVKPILLRDVARIHPLLGLLSILGGVFSFGPMGFLIGPVILSLVLSAARIYRLDVLRSPEAVSERKAS